MKKQLQTVFYSWQSDIPAKVNRNFIQTALKKAVESLTAKDLISVEPVIDRDTQNVAGACKIADTIFEKIDKAAVFVADVTIIGRARNRGKQIPNPNVLVELGYALKVLTAERLIFVTNTAFGSVEDLPFDLRGRRTLPYSLAEKDFENNRENQEKRRQAKKDLQTGLEEALKSIFQLPPRDLNTLPPQLLFLNGAKSLQQMASTTIGPRGGRIVLVEFKDKRRIVTRDGHTIAANLNDPDYHVRLGIDGLERVAEDTREQVGDGAKTAMLLCYEMVRGGYEAVSGGAQLFDILNGMELAVQKAVNYIKEQTQPLNKGGISQIATTAGGMSAANLLTTAFDNSSPDAVLTVEEGIVSNKSSVHTQEGVVFQQGYLADDFINHPNGDCVFEDCFVLICEGKIYSHNQLLQIIQEIASAKAPIFTLAEEIEGEALTLLVQNNGKTISCVAVKAPGYGENKKSWIKDIAVITGSDVFGGIFGKKLENADLSALGKAKKIIVGKNQTQIIGGQGNEVKVAGRIFQLREQIAQTTSHYEREKLQERLANLLGNIAIIKIGGRTRQELLDNKYKVTTSMFAVRFALEGGYVLGGGLTLLNAQAWLESEAQLKSNNQSENDGIEIIRRALREPIQHLLATRNKSVEELQRVTKNQPEIGFNLMNEQFENLRDAGIWDSSQVTQSVLEIAFSHAKMILETASLGIMRQDGRNM